MRQTRMASRIVAIDAGNTNVKAALFEGGRLAHMRRFVTDRNDTPLFLSGKLAPLLGEAGIEPGPNGGVGSKSGIDGVIISSVVPSLTPALAAWAKSDLRLRPLLVDPALDLGFSIDYDDPHTLGADRLCAAAGAMRLYDPPVVVVDCGTAATFSIVDGNRRFRGGAIVPGLHASWEAFERHIPDLPKTVLTEPDGILGKTTVAAMTAGTVYGMAALIDGLAMRFRDELGVPLRVIATGGWSHLAAKYSRMVDAVEPHLNVYGLLSIWERNV